MKYIDLHAHLDGSITPDIAKKLAELQGIAIEADDERLRDILSVPEDCESLNDFLKCFEYPLSLLQTSKGISAGVEYVLDDMKRVGTVYAEVRFAPQLHMQNGLSQGEVIEAALNGLNKSDIRANLILCCMRGSDNHDANMETVRMAYKYLVRDGGVVGLDLAGAEGLYPTSDYADIFAEAARLGIPFTIHAGEAAGADSVWAAVKMGASRIGHGVRIAGDARLMKLIREKGIWLEMCPTSNRITKAVEDMDSYPLRTYLDAGIKVTVNTDDCAIVRSDIAKEYDYAAELASLSDVELRGLFMNAVMAAFTTDEVKADLMKLL